MVHEFFKWKEEYSVGVELIDNQHKVIIKMLNDLNNAFLNKEHGEVVLDIISEMANYTVLHFKTEEDIFKAIGYSLEKEHIKEHVNFIKKVGEFKTQYEENNSALTFKVLNFLREWLNSHILVSDMKYVKEFQLAHVHA